MNTRKVMAGPLGTFLKVFMSTVLTLWIAMDDLWCMDMESIKALLSAGVIAGMPVILNYLNPEYKNYGKGAE
jgi:hypothetical protein